MQDMEHGKIQKAMALRVKYRLMQAPPYKRRIGIRSMGVHQLNRGPPEIYPNGTDVRTLGLALIASTLDQAEADHNGVVIEEVPAEVRMASGFKDPFTTKAYEGIGRYNFEMCCRSECLRTCFTEEAAHAVVYGTLSHSHLLLFLLSAWTGAKWDALDKDGNPGYPCDKDGRVDFAAVAARDAVFKAIVDAGIEVEVLSYKLYLEEPNGCMLISDALNNAQGVALKRTELAAVSALTAEVGTRTELAVAGRVSFQAVKEALRVQLDTIVDEPEFMEMFDFVVSLGADKNTYLPGFLKWCSLFVSNQHRRFRFQTCAALNKLFAGPLSKIALAKRSLRLKPTATMCPVPEAILEKLTRDEFKSLEEILYYFHTECKAAVAALLDPSDEGNRDPSIKFLGNVDVAAADAFVKASSTGGFKYVATERKKAMVVATAKYWQMLKTGVHELKGVVNSSFPTFSASLEAEPQTSAVAEVRLTEPCVIRYDEDLGLALRRPEERTRVADPQERIKMPWALWAESEPAGKLPEEKACEAAAHLVLRMLHRQACSCNPPIDVFWDPKENATVVVTTETIAAGHLKLAPCIPKTMKFKDTSEHPERIQIRIVAKQGGAEVSAHDVFIHPEWQAPEDAKVSGQHAVACEHRAWKWTGGESMHPHWAVRRLTRDKLAAKAPGANFNMAPIMQGYSIVTVGQRNEDEATSVSNMHTVQVPILTNHEDLAKGVELFWEAASVPKKGVPKSKIGWMEDEKAKQAKAKTEKQSQQCKRQKIKDDDTKATLEV